MYRDTGRGATGQGLLSWYRVSFRARNEPRVDPENDRSKGSREGTGKGVGSLHETRVYNYAVFERKKEIRGERRAICVVSRAYGFHITWGVTK